MAGPENEDHVELNPTEARAGQHAYVRYVLIASLILVVSGFIITAVITLG